VTLHNHPIPRFQYDIPSPIYFFDFRSTAFLPPSLLLRSALAAARTVSCSLDVVVGPVLYLLLSDLRVLNSVSVAVVEIERDRLGWAVVYLAVVNRLAPTVPVLPAPFRLPVEEDSGLGLRL
jgi:hypothetical protein